MARIENGRSFEPLLALDEIPLRLADIGDCEGRKRRERFELPRFAIGRSRFGEIMPAESRGAGVQRQLELSAGRPGGIHGCSLTQEKTPPASRRGLKLTLVFTEVNTRDLHLTGGRRGRPGSPAHRSP